MNLSELKSTLRELIVKDLDLALVTAKTSLPESTPKAQQVLLLNAQQADLKRSVMSGIIAQADMQLNTNQIRSKLLSLVESLTEGDLVISAGGGPAPVTAASPKFLVVYDTLDQAFATQLNRHLNILKLTGKIKLYNVVSDVKPGEDPVLRAQQEWGDADYMLALITVNLFNSPDWFELVYKALGEGRRVIPIRIQRADYEGTGLEKLQSLPTGNRAVADFSNADEAYTNIVSEIRRLLPRLA